MEAELIIIDLCLIYFFVYIALGATLTTVAMIGKFGISASFAILVLYTAELYPTRIRY